MTDSEKSHLHEILVTTETWSSSTQNHYSLWVMPLCFYFLNIPEICLDITMVSTCHQRIRSCSYSSPPQSQVTVHRWHAEFLVSTPAEGEMNTTSSWVFPSGIFTTKEMHECQNISFGLKRKVFPLHPQVVFKGIFWKWEEEGPPTLELLDASDWQNLGEEKKKKTLCPRFIIVMSQAC